MRFGMKFVAAILGFLMIGVARAEDASAQAQAAIDKFNNYSFGGRNLTVNEARPRPERSGAFGGGGRGGDYGGGGGRGGGRREPRW